MRLVPEVCRTSFRWGGVDALSYAGRFGVRNRDNCCRAVPKLAYTLRKSPFARHARNSKQRRAWVTLQPNGRRCKPFSRVFADALPSFARFLLLPSLLFLLSTHEIKIFFTFAHDDVFRPAQPDLRGCAGDPAKLVPRPR